MIEETLSRQRKWQIKMVAQGRCLICGKPSTIRSLCKIHLAGVRARERNRYARRIGRVPNVYTRRTADDVEVLKK